jgi:hypothetical protein
LGHSSPDIEIWMMEWGYAVWSGVPLQDESDWNARTIQASPITGIYLASFLIAMVGRSQSAANPHTAANHQLLIEQANVNWGAGAGATKLSADGPLVSAAGQIFLHILYIALQLSDMMMPVEVTGADLPFDVEGVSGPKCVFASAFAHSCRPGALPVYVAINRCDSEESLSLPTVPETATTSVCTTSYSGDISSDTDAWVAIASLVGDYFHPWSDGPVAPAISVTALTPADSATVQLNALSLMVIEFEQPRASLRRFERDLVYHRRWYARACAPNGKRAARI